MMDLTDGRKLIWAVFNADGYECKDLVGVFELENDAIAAADRIRSLIQAFYAENMDGEWKGSVTVETMALGEYELPADAMFMAKATE